MYYRDFFFFHFMSVLHENSSCSFFLANDWILIAWVPEFNGLMPVRAARLFGRAVDVTHNPAGQRLRLFFDNSEGSDECKFLAVSLALKMNTSPITWQHR